MLAWPANSINNETPESSHQITKEDNESVGVTPMASHATVTTDETTDNGTDRISGEELAPKRGKPSRICDGRNGL